MGRHGGTEAAHTARQTRTSEHVNTIIDFDSVKGHHRVANEVCYLPALAASLVRSALHAVRSVLREEKKLSIAALPPQLQRSTH